MGVTSLTYNQNNFYQKVFCCLRSLTVDVPALVAGVTMMLFSQSAFTQCTIACRGNLNISLSETGQAEITPEFLLQDPDCDPNNFTVSITDPSGTSIGNILNCSHIGQNFIAKVTNINSGNYCQSNLAVYDYFSPVMMCKDTIVFCSVSTDPQYTGYPTVSDNCTTFDNSDLSYSDSFTELACYTIHNGDSVTGRIVRTWLAVDENGNQSSCQQNIYLKRATVNNVVFPAHRDGFASAALDCKDDPNDLDITGRPSIAGFPLDINGNCELVVDFEDQIVPACGPASYKILRKWTVIDWCSGDYKLNIQVIKVEDKKSPVVTCPQNITVSTSPYSCTATVNLPATTATDDCSTVTITPSWGYGSGYGPFSSVLLGTHIVNYIAEDACGNTSSCQMTVTVIDNTSPVAVCDLSTQITLSSSGEASILAETFDDGSYDNCGIDVYEVSRDGINYYPEIEFGCDDIAISPLMVHLRVIDLAGNYNECTVEATIKDRTRPVLICPSDTTLECTADFTNLQTTGMPTVIDDCIVDTLYYSDQLNLNACNVGTIVRTWTAFDISGNKSVCTQRITLVDNTPLTVIFPENADYYNCGSNVDPAITGQPTFQNDNCESIYQTYSDQVFDFAPPACFKIFRTWEVIDWCIYDPNSGNNNGYWMHTQVISVFDNIAPVISCPPNTIVGNTNASCGAVIVSLPPATATDCSSQVTITNDSPYATGNGADASGNYPSGIHTITFTAVDGCGNSSTCFTILTVEDTKPPTPKCKSGVVINLSTDGMVTINPSTINNGSTDNCTVVANLQLQVIPASFSCDDLGEQVVQFIVTDEAGNSAACTTIINIQDNQGHCPFANLEGLILTETGLPVKNVSIGLAGGATNSVRTDANGTFIFKDLAIGENYTLTPSKDTNMVNGISTFDLVRISQHILGMRALGSPYQMIAADANNSGTITTFDIVMLRKVILFISNTLPNNTSWRFVDANHVFSNPMNPFASSFPESIVIDHLSGAMTDLSFIAIKIGDTNGSANLQNFSGNNSQRNATDFNDMKIKTAELEMKAGEIYPVFFTAAEMKQIDGFQFTLDFDPAMLSFESLESNEALMNEDDFGWTKTNEGKITASWIATPSSDLYYDSTLLFKMRFRALQNVKLSQAIKINSSYTNAEAYRAQKDGEYTLEGIQLVFEKEQSETEFRMAQNYPNPFNQQTTIEVESGGSSLGYFSIHNASGKLLVQKKIQLEKGVNKIQLSQEELQLPAGCYIYHIRTSDGHQKSRKMMLLP